MNSPYLILPIGILSLTLYFLTLILSRLSIIKLTVHRKFWNVLLLITFFVTALLGLTLAIQVNYKLKIPFIRQLLTLHVDFGLSMTMIAVFHFLWHWNYYSALLKKKSIKEPGKRVEQDQNSLITETSENQGRINLSAVLPLIALGYTAILSQIILLREFLNIYGGNELICGLILANWMILTGTGAFLGKIAKNTSHSGNFIFYAFILLGLIPPVSIFLLNNLKNIIFEPGISIGLFKILFSSFILLLPFCVLSGFLFTYLATKLSSEFKANLIEKAYAFESIGSIIGGGVFSFILVYFLTTYQVLGILLLSNIVIVLILTVKRRLNVYKVLLLIVSILFIILVFASDFDLFAKKALFKNQDLLFLKDTPYGNLSITRTGDQKNFYENNILLFTTHNIIENEEAVHYAMLQHNDPKNVLLISGGISGITDEILKYDVDKIDYIELNPWIFKLGKKYTATLEDKRINTIEKDARLFLKKTSDKYDVVLINLPEPSNAQINRYYTIEFLKELKKRLKKNAIISLSLTSTANYISKEAVLVNSAIFNTVKSVFKNVLIIPGEKNFFIISDSTLDLNIVKLVEVKKLENTYVNQYYIDDETLKNRSYYILSNINRNVNINRDFRPVSYFNQLVYWISKFNINIKTLFIIGIIVCTGLIIILINLRPVNLGIFTAGFTASSIEIILIISFQIIYGYVYHTLGIIITIFMAGLSVGALLRNKIFREPKPNHYIILQFSMAIYAITLPFIIIFIDSLSVLPNLVHIIFFLLTILVSFIIGLLFSVATHLQKERISIITAKVYSVDLIGSALGALIVTVFLIPLTGIVFTCVILGSINFLSALLTFLKRKSIIRILSRVSTG